ncbi:MAG: histidinol dehydrogenase [candidate division KSB1 bacterium]|nr:histidinol dehydrogenase [candidate division KSB1 bacterium]
MKVVQRAELTEDFFKYQELEETASVKAILSEVQKNGDAAIRKYSLAFDGVAPESFRVEPEEIKKAYEGLDKDTIATLEAAVKNISQFALKQKEPFQDFEYEIQPGVFTGQKVIPIERVGVYAPGGRFPLPSTVLMCSLPARIAGVKEIVLCSPPSCDGTIHPAILVAADMARVNEVYRIGGVQAIAAMAYGTESIKPVDKIVGPGNKYVTEAKKLVYGRVGIDFVAGPTEVMIIADETAHPAFIAADLLAQAEHDPNATPVLITNSPTLAREVEKEMGRQLPELTTKEIARQALEQNGLIILVSAIDEALEIANRKAPEHLELQVKNPDDYVAHLKNYGSLFIGDYAAEALGDYSSGLNHTLPTNTCARYTGGLSVRDFLKIQTTLRVTKEGFSSIGPVAKRFGELEGLDGHAKSIDVRVVEPPEGSEPSGEFF